MLMLVQRLLRALQRPFNGFAEAFTRTIKRSFDSLLPAFERSLTGRIKASRTFKGVWRTSESRLKDI